jgi:glycine oxidase
MDRYLVIGAGINGLMTAYYLAEAGHSVTLIDRGEVGKESSWAGGGILSPLYPWRYPTPVANLVKWSQQHYPTLVKTLKQNTQIDPQLICNGLLITDENEIENAVVWSQETNVPVEIVNTKQIEQLEPSLGLTPKQAIWMPQVAQVRNPRLVRALKSFITDQGVQIKEHTEVSSLQVDNQQVRGIQTTNEFIEGDFIAVTCGAWTRQLFALLNTSINIEPVKGQMILFKTKPDLVQRIILSQGHYAIPRNDGRLLFGSTLEHTGFEKATTTQAYNNLKDLAYTMIPSLTDYPIENHWAGLRPGSPDGVPTISAHPNIKGLFINAGQFRNGVVMAPASARLLVDLMLGKNTSVDPRDYQLSDT